VRSSAEPSVVEAVRLAVEAAGLGEPAPAAGAWCTAALAEAVGEEPVTSLAQARSPRSTVGATRA
jgi:hypothetical protein